MKNLSEAGGVLSQGVECVQEGLQFSADDVEAFDSLGTARDAGVVVAQLFLGRLQMQSLFLYKECHHSYFLDIGRCIGTCAVAVASGRNYSEPALPEAKGRGRQSDKFGDFGYFVIFFL